MKKPLLIIIIILVVIFALPAVNFIRWIFQEKKPMDIVVLNKTVPTLERLKHKSFHWILTSERFVKKGKKTSYSYKKDYFGFSPTRPLREKGSTRKEYRLAEMIDLPEKTDVLYIADTYGVFFNDWYSGINKSRRSRKIYGGLNNNDYLFISEMKNRNKLVILEYNSFDYPTAQFESVRTQEKLGINFSGWTGKYFEKLDTVAPDFPIWLTAMYRKQHKQPWTFKKAGIVLLTEKNIIVLEEGTHLKNPLPLILTDSANCAKYGVPSSVAFNNWFDIIDPLNSNVISRFRIETTALGDTLFEKNSLDNEFPAVIREQTTNNLYYFAGDFATNKVWNCTSRIKSFEKLKGILYSSNPNDPRRFYWLYYKPLINTILTDYYNTIKSN